jgi:hypothetical protein
MHRALREEESKGERERERERERRVRGGINYIPKREEKKTPKRAG